MAEDGAAAAGGGSAGARPATVIVGMGSNQEPERNLPLAARLLGERAEVLRRSSAWATTPVGPPGQPPYLNAAMLVRTALAPARVKSELLRPIEAALGRVRTGDRFAPRPIDLDLVAYGEEVMRAEGLEVPEPDLLRHAHVALPASEVAPAWRHPQTGEPLQTIADRLIASLPPERRPRRLALALG